MTEKLQLIHPLKGLVLRSTLYFYAREVVNHSWIDNGAVHRPHSGSTTTAFHDLARGTGLEHEEVHPLSGLATVAAARQAGIKAHSSPDVGHCSETYAAARRFIDG